MSDEPLVIQGLSKTYANGVQALKNVSLTIRTGLFGLLGPNGAGKSTLMRILATLQQADTGVARLGQLDLLARPDEARKVLGYLPQDFGFDPQSTPSRCSICSRRSRESPTVASGNAWSMGCSRR